MPGVFTIEQFSRSASVDLETAISLAVTRTINGVFPGPGGKGKIQLVEVFEDWPTFEDNFVSPSGVVLPDGELLYGPSHLIPRLLEETWEPKGEQGFGLFELSEGTREVVVQVRSGIQAERNALKAGIEGAFVAPSVLVAPDLGSRYGTIVNVPEYWNMPVRLTLIGSHKLDDADKAAKNQWEAEFRIAAQAPHVVLRPVPPFKVKFRQLEVGDTVVVDPDVPSPS